MPCRERVAASRAVLCGKPVVRGTWPAVDFLLGLLGAGWTEAQLIDQYPQLTRDDVQACLAFAAGVRQNTASPRPAVAAEPWS